MENQKEKLNIILQSIQNEDFEHAWEKQCQLEKELESDHNQRKMLEPEYGIASSAVYMQKCNFEKALEIIKESLYFVSDNYELYYSAGMCYENLSQSENAYFYYLFAMFLGRESEDQEILRQAFENLCSYADANEYQLGKCLENLIKERLDFSEYENTYAFLNQVLHDKNKEVGRIVLSEENMLLCIMLEIVSCEKNKISEIDFQKENTCVRYQNDISKFKKAYQEIKFMIRRIWFGFDKESQGEINKVLARYPVSGDMLAVVAKYSIIEENWQDMYQRLYELIKDEHPKQAQIIQCYKIWLEQENIGGKGVCDKPMEYENQAQIIKLDWNQTENRNSENRDSIKDETKISIIYCTNSELYSRECNRYLKRLQVPKGMSLDIIEVWNAKSMAAGYNYAMSYSDAKYKIYIHHDTFLIYHEILNAIISIFKENGLIGALGVGGAIKLPDSGLWWKADMKDRRFALYQDGIMTILQSLTIDKKGEWEFAEAIDGYFIATAVDVRWREDLFDGWHFYDISQCFEIAKEKKNVLVNDEKMWILHESIIRREPLNLYEKYRKVFLKEYRKEGTIDGR